LLADAIRQIGVSEVTYYRWRQEFGGLKTEQMKRLKDLELENSRLRKAVSDSPCCARVTSGHATPLPISEMNSRRFIQSPRWRAAAER
jgi:hypothetical protein